MTVNVEALEKLNQQAIRMVTGQSVGSCREAIRLEAGVPSYQTIRKRNILTAKERALRTSADHPAYIAATNPGINQRLKVRKGFRYTSQQLSEYLPPEATDRRPIDLSIPPPWEQNGKIRVSPATVKKASLADDKLKSRTMDEIRKEEADVVIYTDGSADSGLWKGGSAAVITTGDPEQPAVTEIIMKRGADLTCSTEEEVAALKSATTWIQDNEAHSKILICTDSNALCQALLNPKPGEIATLKRELEKSPGEIHVKWVPAHVLIDGNEIADKKAKEATRLNTTPRAASYQAAKKLIRRNVIDPPTQHENRQRKFTSSTD